MTSSVMNDVMLNDWSCYSYQSCNVIVKVISEILKDSMIELVQGSFYKYVTFGQYLVHFNSLWISSVQF